MSEETKIKEISFDGFMGWSDVALVVPYSRKTVWMMEKKGLFPKRRQLSPGRVAWLGSEIKEWINTRPRVNIESRAVEIVTTA